MEKFRIMILVLVVLALAIGVVALVLSAIGYVPPNPSGSESCFLVANSKKRRWTSDAYIPDGEHYVALKDGLAYDSSVYVNTTVNNGWIPIGTHHPVQKADVILESEYAVPADVGTFYATQVLTAQQSAITQHAANHGVLSGMFHPAMNFIGFLATATAGTVTFGNDCQITMGADAHKHAVDTHFDRRLHWNVTVNASFTVAGGATPDISFLLGFQWHKDWPLVDMVAPNGPIAKCRADENSVSVSLVNASVSGTPAITDPAPTNARWRLNSAGNNLVFPEAPDVPNASIELGWNEVHLYDDNMKNYVLPGVADGTYRLFFTYDYRKTWSVPS